jgi:hypothetical protein
MITAMVTILRREHRERKETVRRRPETEAVKRECIRQEIISRMKF